MSTPIPTPRTDAEASDGWSGDAICVSADFARTLKRELIAEREKAERYRLYGLRMDILLATEIKKVRVLREACGIIERKAGEDYDERVPLSEVGDIASAALVATEDKP